MSSSSSSSPSKQSSITGHYRADLHVELHHPASGTHLETAAPEIDGGDGKGFSPTDLLAGALLSCMLTAMATLGQRRGLDLTDLEATATTRTNLLPRRRIAAIDVTITLPAGLPSEERLRLERAAATCPVHRSLSNSVEATVAFRELQIDP